MKKTFITLLGVTLLTVFAFGQNEKKLVKKTFDDYKKSILEGKGSEAIKYVNTATIDYYAKELDLAVSGDSVTVDDLELLDKLIVLIARHRIPADQLLKMSGSDFFIYAVDNGMIGKNSVASIEMGDVTVEENSAKGQMVTNGQKTPLYFQFSKESNDWKVDITSIFPATGMALKKMLEENEVSDNDFILQTLEMTGKKVADNIWQPLK